MRANSKGERCPILLNSEDEDEDGYDFLPPARERKSNATHGAITDASAIMEDLADIKKDLKSVLPLTPESSIPLGLKCT